ncbi:MAG: cytochrome C biogenesis protein CcmE [Candidatus Binatia bacterium]|nr:MAG: cytochrome C biogenesis protein CcmE [Candidatus Binatia bacterium]
MGKKARLGFAAFVLVGVVAYLMYTGVRQTAVYYITVNEFAQRRHQLVGEGVRVAGRVASGSVKRRMTPAGEEVWFEIGDFKDDGGTTPVLQVYYTGVVPDMFRNEGGSDVIVEGRYDGSVLRAQSLMTSCPSKYEPMEPASAAQAGGN